MSLQELSVKFKEAKEQFIKSGTESIKAEFSKVFEEHPEITCVKWYQNCPSFNDGDPCYFSVGDFFVSNVVDPNTLSHYGEFDDEEDVGEEVFVIESWSDKEKKYQDIWNIEKFSSSDLGSEIFEQLFGTNAIVTVTRDGIDVEEYYDY